MKNSRNYRTRTRIAAALVVAVGVGIVASLGGVGSAATGLAGVGGAVFPDANEAASPSGGVAPAASASQYQFPGYLCARKRWDKRGYKYKLFYARSERDYDGWEPVYFYGPSPGPCPPA